MPRLSLTSRQVALLAAPPVLLATTYATYKGMAAWLGSNLGYLAGFLFYWIFWCLLLPLWAVGPDELRVMFKAPRPPFGQPAWLGLLLLLTPVVVAWITMFPTAVEQATPTIVISAALFSVVNGTLEEVLWRGTYVSAFPGSWLWGVVYPSIGFGFWHLAPQAVYSDQGPGGALAFAVMAIFLGLPFGWVAKKSGSIRWVVLAHILLDFAALDGRPFLWS